MFHWLRTILRDHPAYNKPSLGEVLVLKTMTKGTTTTKPDPAKAAIVLEELGAYDEALTFLAGVTDGARAQATLRILRTTERYSDLEAALSDTKAGPDDVAVETGHLLIARNQFTRARDLFRTAVHAHEASPRIAELHFLAGKASWFAGDRDWARFHWMWVWNQRPEHRLAMRSKICACFEVMPYPNPELNDYAATGNIGTGHIEAECIRSQAFYEKLAPVFAAKRWDEPAAPAKPTPSSGEPEDGDGDTVVLAGRLVDGNPHRVANNKIVDLLVTRGQAALDALVPLVEDKTFRGRGYAAWALAKVLKAMEDRPAKALEVLRKAARSEHPYVGTLARSGLNHLGAS